MWTRTRALPPATGSVRSRRSCSSSRAKSSPTRSSGRFRRPNSERSWTLSPDTPRGGDRISTSGIGIPSLSPTRDEFRALAAEGNLVPVFAELPADLDPRFSASWGLGPGPSGFLLESVGGGEVWARSSFLSADPLMVLTAKNGRLTLKRGSRLERLPDGNPLQAVRDLLGQFQPVAVPGLPRFQGGAVGYLAYDMVHHMERLPRTTEDDLGLPDAVFLFTDTLLVFDNLRHRLLVIANAVVDKRDPASLDRAYDRAAVRIGMTLAKLARPTRAPAPLTLAAPGPLQALGEEGFTSTMNEQQFTDAVRRAKEYIAAGDAYQIVLSRRLDCHLTGDPFTVYRALRTINPSPYLFFLRPGQLMIVGSSPEAPVRVQGGAARRRSARWKPSMTSSRPSAARTAAPWVTCRTRATSTRASRSGRSSATARARRSRSAPASSRTPIRRPSGSRRARRPRGCCWRSGWRRGWRGDDPRHRQLRLVHLQPRPVPVRARRPA